MRITRKLSVLIVLVLSFTLAACGDSDAQVQTIEEIKPTSKVKIELACKENLFFNRYDLDAYVDGIIVGSLEHGQEQTFEVELEHGVHTLKVVDQGDSSTDGEVEFSVPERLNLRYELSCTGDQVEIVTIDDIVPPSDAIDLVNNVYRDVETMFTDAGFTNVVTVGLKDLSADTMADYGIVTKVSIDGNSSFTMEEVFFPEDEVVIEYHSGIEVNPPYDGVTSLGKQYDTVADAFEAAGFIDVKTEAAETIWEGDANTVSEIYIDGERCDVDEVYPIDAEVKITYYMEQSESTDSADELTAYYAQKAMEEYGESRYPYGFDPHWIMDLRNQEQMDDGSWYLKVGVTITNVYGTEYDTVAEGIVSGTDIFPVVTQFYVS